MYGALHNCLAVIGIFITTIISSWFAILHIIYTRLHRNGRKAYNE